MVCGGRELEETGRDGDEAVLLAGHLSFLTSPLLYEVVYANLIRIQYIMKELIIFNAY